MIRQVLFILDVFDLYVMWFLEIHKNVQKSANGF